MKDDMMCSRPDCTACDVFQRPNETDVEWKDRLRKMMTAAETCAHGHPREGNTRYTTEGYRFCVICRRASSRESHARIRERAS